MWLQSSQLILVPRDWFGKSYSYASISYDIATVNHVLANTSIHINIYAHMESSTVATLAGRFLRSYRVSTVLAKGQQPCAKRLPIYSVVCRLATLAFDHPSQDVGGVQYQP